MKNRFCMLRHFVLPAAALVSLLLARAEISVAAPCPVDKYLPGESPQQKEIARPNKRNPRWKFLEPLLMRKVDLLAGGQNLNIFGMKFVASKNGGLLFFSSAQVTRRWNKFIPIFGRVTIVIDGTPGWLAKVENGQAKKLSWVDGPEYDLAGVNVGLVLHDKRLYCLSPDGALYYIELGEAAKEKSFKLAAVLDAKELVKKIAGDVSHTAFLAFLKNTDKSFRVVLESTFTFPCILKL